MQIMNQMIQDGMQFEDEIDDSDVNNLVAKMEKQAQRKKMEQAERVAEMEEEN